MGARQDGKKRPPDFGKRGRANIAGSERKPKALQRLMKVGRRWWAKIKPNGKKHQRGLDFKRSRLKT
jgi:hypothetical protein